MRIVLCYPAEPHHIAEIARAAPAAEIWNAGQERIAEEILAADVYCGHAKVPVPWDEVVARGRLDWIQSTAAGVDHCLAPSVVKSAIRVTSISGVLADQVAEHALALVLGHLRSLPVFYRAQHAREFQRRPTRDLHGSTVGIVGLGGVGRRLAELLAAFKTRILATDWCPVDRPAHVESLWPADRLHDLLPLVDILFLCAPLNAHTQHMIHAETLSIMRRGAILVNVARGGLVAEEDLVSALRSGQVAAAALDVVENEPLAVSSPLWAAPNLVITPHVAGQSARRIDDTTDFFCRNLRRYQRGERLLNIVDKELGFPLRSDAVESHAPH